MARDRLAAMRVRNIWYARFQEGDTQDQHCRLSNNNSVEEPMTPISEFSSAWVGACGNADRLFAFRQSYPTQQEGGGGYSRRANPYAQQDDRAYEMQDVHQSSTALVPDMGYTGNSGGNAGDMASFYSEVRFSFFWPYPALIDAA
jgi:hypothetical protein